ncbi:ribosome modulation factor [Methylobacterium sp. P31]
MTLSSRSPTIVSEEGRHARDRGDPITANPYPAGSDAHRTWERGYRMPDEEARETLPTAAADNDQIASS